MYIICLFALLIFSCNLKEPSAIETKKHYDSLHVAKVDSINTTKEVVNVNDRTIWQKPLEIIDLLGDIEDKVIADIGAGSGYFSFKFIHKAKKVIALDIDTQLIALMNDELNYYKPEIRTKFEARLAEPNDPKIKENEVDIIFISNTYTYLNNKVQYLKNLRKCLKPEGRIMIVDFKRKITPIGPDVRSRLAQGDIELDLLDSGFKIIYSDDKRLDYQYIIIAKL